MLGRPCHVPNLLSLLQPGLRGSVELRWLLVAHHGGGESHRAQAQGRGQGGDQEADEEVRAAPGRGERKPSAHTRQAATRNRTVLAGLHWHGLVFDDVAFGQR